MHWLTDTQKDEIRHIAGSSPDEETCGVVLDDGSVRQLKNQAANPRDEFAIDPLDYAKHEDQLIGIWHSHLRLAGFSPLDQQVLSSDVVPWAVYCLKDDSFHECDPSTRAPFKERPFVFGVYDCYSLISDVLVDMGIELPEWKRGKWGEWNTPEFRPFDMEWEKVGKPVTNASYQKGDILLLNLGDYSGHTDHVGVFVNDRQFLHHPADGVSRLQTFGGYWSRRLNWVVRPFPLWSS